jgi:hypothetical protein
MQAVKEYDTDLSLGRHEQTGEWVILLQRGPMDQPHPVFGLGHELPAPEQLKQRLYESDVRRHGAKLAVALMKAQDRRQKELQDKFSDETGVVAEAFEWAHRKEGTHPNPRVFVPEGVKT